MSEQDQLQRSCRMWVYLIAILHLVCLALLHRAPSHGTQALTHYACYSAADQSTPAAAFDRTL